MKSIRHRSITFTSLIFSVLLLSGCFDQPNTQDNSINDSNTLSDTRASNDTVNAQGKNPKKPNNNLPKPPQLELPSTASFEHTLFTIAGSNTLGAQMMPSLAADFLQKAGATQVEIKSTPIENEVVVVGNYTPAGKDVIWLKIPIASHGSSTGFKSLKNSDADIGASSRPIKTKELELLEELGKDFESVEHEHIVALDGLAIIVNQLNPIQTLDTNTIKDIFSGKITRWEDCSDFEGPIQIFARDNKSGTYDTFKSLVLSGKKLSKKANRYESNRELSKQVSQTPTAIGFTSISEVNQAKPLAINVKGTKPLTPNELTVAIEDYPLSRRLYLYTLPTIKHTVRTADSKVNNIKEFINFVASKQGQKVVKDTGFIAQNLKTLTPPKNDSRNQNYNQLVNDALRVNLNFRFKEKETGLDNKSQTDLSRFVEFMEQPEFANKEILLIGFSNNYKTLERTLLLARLRAFSVSRAMKKSGIKRKIHIAYDNYTPVASNDPSQKNKNRRVEVWLIDKGRAEKKLLANR